MNRIEKKFEELRAKGKKALITYVTGGDPSIEQTEQYIYDKEGAGADIIEIGIPFSDPLADGPVIQVAAQRALDNGVTLDKIFKCITNVRKKSQVPLAFLVYFNTVLYYGAERFVKKCEEIGIDGLIIPDLPKEEREEIQPYIDKSNVSLIPLVAPNSRDRIKSVIEGGSGFVYCVSSLGVTGVRQEFYKEVESFLQEVRKNTTLPLAVGFGISKKEDVEKLQPYVDGVIIGSAIVKKIEEDNGKSDAMVKYLKDIKSVM